MVDGRVSLRYKKWATDGEWMVPQMNEGALCQFGPISMAPNKGTIYKKAKMSK